MRRLRSDKGQFSYLYSEKSLVKYPKDVLRKTTPKTKSILEFHSCKINELTIKSKQKIHTTGKFCSRLSTKTLKKSPQMLSKRGVKPTSTLKTTLRVKKGPAADEVKSKLKSKKQQNTLDRKSLRISQTKSLKSQNKSKEPHGQNELHHDAVHISKFQQGSPDKTARSSRYSLRLQSVESSKNNSEHLQPSVLPEFKKQQDILNEKTSCMPKKLQRKSSDEMKKLQRQNEVHRGAVVHDSGFINPESPNAVAQSSRRSTRSCKSLDVPLLKSSVSPEFKNGQKILNEKTPCISKKLRCKSSSKIKDLQEQNEVYHDTTINVSGFINETACLSSRRSMTSQSPEFLRYRSCSIRLSKVSGMSKFKQKNILNEKTPCNPKEVRLRSSNKIKDLQGQNKVQNETTINTPALINESPNETARSSRKSIRLQTQEFLSKKSDNVQLSKLPITPKFKKQQHILNEKTPCVPNKLRLKSSNKMKNLRERHKTPLNKSLNESTNRTSRSSSKSKSKRLLPQEFSKNKSKNTQLSKRPKNSKIQPKAKEIMTPKTKSNKHSSFTPKNTSTVVKRCVQKLTENRQKPKRHKSLINIPIDDLAFSPFIKRQTKSDGYKVPGKNTLKRKRLAIETIKKADEEYEDDIYEEREFANFKNILPDTSDSELSYTMATPKLLFNLTPQIRCKTPLYKDCFSPKQYAVSRKVAEECFYRKKKRLSKSKPENPAAVPEKKKIEFDEILEKASKVQKEVENLAVEESDCEDDYFTDDEK